MAVRFFRKRKTERKSPKVAIIAITISLLLAIFLAGKFGLIRENCKQDTQCFEKAAKTCQPATYLTLKNLNYYRYTIYGERKGNCEVKIELKKMAVGTPLDRREVLEGKAMECSLPKAKLDDLAKGEITSLLKQCTGPLKEGMYELIIKKLHSIVISNLGDIIGSLEEVLKSEKV